MVWTKLCRLSPAWKLAVHDRASQRGWFSTISKVYFATLLWQSNGQQNSLISRMLSSYLYKIISLSYPARAEHIQQGSGSCCSCSDKFSKHFEKCCSAKCHVKTPVIVPIHSLLACWISRITFSIEIFVNHASWFLRDNERHYFSHEITSLH